MKCDPRRRKAALHVPRVAILVDTATSWGRGIISGILQYLRQHEFWELYVEPRGTDEHPRVPRGWQGEGIIARVGDTLTARRLRALRLPVVNVSAVHLGTRHHFPQVASDVGAVARLAAEYFLDRGFRNFGYLSLRGLEYALRHQQAFEQAVTATGCHCSVYGVRTHSGAQTPDWNLRLESLGQWLLSMPKPAAILTWSGGREVIHACQLIGLRVPEEISLLSGSEDFLCEASQVPISAVQVDFERIGVEAADLLRRLMRGAKAPPPTFIPPLRIVTRQSSDTLAISDPALVKALNFIRQNVSRIVRIGEVAAHAGVSRRLLQQKFLRILGRTPSAHIRRAHLDRARTLLAETSLSIDQVAEASGFGSPEYMTLCFRRTMKVTPLKFRWQAQGRSP